MYHMNFYLGYICKELFPFMIYNYTVHILLLDVNSLANFINDRLFTLKRESLNRDGQQFYQI